MKQLASLPGYEAQLLPTLKDTIDRMTEKSAAAGHHGQDGGSQRRASKRISLGFAGIGAGGGFVGPGGNSGGGGDSEVGVGGERDRNGMRSNAGLGMGSVGMAGSVLVADRRNEA